MKWEMLTSEILVSFSWWLFFFPLFQTVTVSSSTTFYLKVKKAERNSEVGTQINASGLELLTSLPLQSLTATMGYFPLVIYLMSIVTNSVIF